MATLQAPVKTKEELDKEAREYANVSKVMKCDCKSHNQDKKHGEGKRLHYRCRAGWRCHACKMEKPIVTRKKKEVPEDGSED